MEPKDYTVIDFEMTGLDAKKDRIIEIGAVRVRNGKKVDVYATLVNPMFPIPQEVTQLTGITDEMVQQGTDMDEALSKLLDFIGDDAIVGHNISFDYRFIKQWAVNQKRVLELYTCDTLKIARKLLPAEQPKKLDALCNYFGISRENAHRALDDAIETWQIFEHLKVLGAEAQSIFEPRILQIRAKKQTPATIHQVKRLKEFRKNHAITEEIHWDVLTRSEASRIMDRYYVTYGRDSQ